jgi:hypothetical protein
MYVVGSLFRVHSPLIGGESGPCGHGAGNAPYGHGVESAVSAAMLIGGDPPIKGNRIDQGRIHADLRSNHEHSPLIGGESALCGHSAGNARRARCAATAWKAP